MLMENSKTAFCCSKFTWNVKEILQKLSVGQVHTFKKVQPCTYCHMLLLRMCGAVPPLLHVFMAWFLIKNR